MKLEFYPGSAFFYFIIPASSLKAIMTGNLSLRNCKSPLKRKQEKVFLNNKQLLFVL